MSSILRSFYALLAGSLLLGASVACAAENPASQASEQTPPASVQGTTPAKGPQKLFDKEKEGAKEEKAAKHEKKDEEKAAKEGKKDEEKKAEPEKKQEPKVTVCKKTDEEKADKHAQKEKKSKDKKAAEKGAAATPAPAAEPAPEAAKPKPAAAEEEEKVAVDENTLRSAIRRLGTSGWREAQVQLVQAGKAAVPYLLDAMGAPEGEAAPAAAYNLGGHTKADSGRASRQRTVAEVCSELLTDIVTNHSNYKGELPTLDQKAWRDWWAANGNSITFAK